MIKFTSSHVHSRGKDQSLFSLLWHRIHDMFATCSLCRRKGESWCFRYNFVHWTNIWIWSHFYSNFSTSWHHNSRFLQCDCRIEVDMNLAMFFKLGMSNWFRLQNQLDLIIHNERWFSSARAPSIIYCRIEDVVMILHKNFQCTTSNLTKRKCKPFKSRGLTFTIKGKTGSKTNANNS